MQGELGRFDSRMHTEVHELAPYGRVELGAGVSTITLLDCDAVAVQLVSERHAIRLGVGSTLPINGVQRFLRNPYSQTIKVEILADLPVQMAPREDERQIGFLAAHGAKVGIQSKDEIAGRRKGLILMAKHGDVYFDARGWSSMNVSLVPDAVVKYQDDLPSGVFADTLTTYDSMGLPNTNYVVRSGEFTDAEMAAWIAATGWNRAPVLISENNNSVKGVLKQGTALVAANSEGLGFELNVDLIDLGSWQPEWRK